MNSEGAHAAHEKRQAHVDHVGEGEEWDDCKCYGHVHSVSPIREKLRQLVPVEIKRERYHQSETERLEEGHHSESLCLWDIVRANLVTDKDASRFLDAETDSITQGRNLHRYHHISLSNDTQIARHDSQELPGPVLCTEHACGGDAQIKVLSPSNPDGGIRPEKSIFDVFQAVSVHHRR